MAEWFTNLDLLSSDKSYYFKRSSSRKKSHYHRLCLLFRRNFPTIS